MPPSRSAKLSFSTCFVLRLAPVVKTEDFYLRFVHIKRTCNPDTNILDLLYRHILGGDSNYG